jgi:hypothetical protein
MCVHGILYVRPHGRVIVSVLSGRRHRVLADRCRQVYLLCRSGGPCTALVRGFQCVVRVFCTCVLASCTEDVAKRALSIGPLAVCKGLCRLACSVDSSCHRSGIIYLADSYLQPCKLCKRSHVMHLFVLRISKPGLCRQICAGA